MTEAGSACVAALYTVKSYKFLGRTLSQEGNQGKHDWGSEETSSGHNLAPVELQVILLSGN